MPVVAPVALAFWTLMSLGVEAHEEDGGLGLVLEDVPSSMSCRALGHDVEDRADGDVGGLDRASAPGRA